ncbi:DUF3267 domain-containing protein [Methanosarcina hadiensis]|uniref:DUF3267 domain-containing protein n=1 Tax=Methanosarcina hadiensis TaxID=3078083 RepID=UPI0039772B73
MLAAVPLMILNTLISITILSMFSPFSLADIGIKPSQGITLTINLLDVASLIGLVFIHEFLHLIFVPDFLTSDKTFLGITYFGGFVYSEEEVSKSRYILITVAPFILLSVILPGILGILDLLNPLVIALILLNSLSSGMDMLTLVLVLIKVPDDVYFTSNGVRTYWKKIDKTFSGTIEDI